MMIFQSLSIAANDIVFVAVVLANPDRSVSGAVGTRITMTGYVIFAIIMVGFIYPVVSRVGLKVGACFDGSSSWV